MKLGALSATSPRKGREVESISSLIREVVGLHKFLSVNYPTQQWHIRR
jgi:hypothetical protein